MKRIYAGILALVLACIGLVAAGTAASASNANQTDYWKAKYPNAVACYKNTHGSVTNGGKAVTLPTFDPSWPGDRWEVLIVKGGSEGGDGNGNAVYELPTAGTPYFAPLNNGGQQADVSHWIVCKGGAPVVVKDKETSASYVVTPPSCENRIADATLTYENATGNYAAGSYPDIAGGTYTVTLTANDGYTFASGKTYTFDVVVPAAFTDEDCKPEDRTPDVVTVDTGVAVCGSDTVPTGTTTTTYTWVFVGGKWNLTSSMAVTTGTRPLTAAEAEQFSLQNCTQKPDDFDEVVWAEAGTPKCGENTVTQTGTRNFYTHTWSGTEYIKSLVKSVPTSRVVDVKVTPCPTETPTATPTPTPSVTTPAPSPSASETPVVSQVTGGPTLAATGSNVLPGIAIALILVMVGAAIVVVVGTRR